VGASELARPRHRGPRSGQARAPAIPRTLLARRAPARDLGRRRRGGRAELPAARRGRRLGAAVLRLGELLDELDDADLFRLLAALAQSASHAAAAATRGELAALAVETLRVVARAWDGSGAPVPPTLLDAWFATAACVADPPAAPQLARTWIELLPTESLDLASPEDVAALDDWVRLVALLSRHARPALAGLGFPERQLATLSALVTRAEAMLDEPPATASLLAEAFRRLAPLVPVPLASRSARVAAWIAPLRAPELSASRATSRTQPAGSRRLVARILRDLRPG
jgi:hypothetical protein